MYYVYLGGPIAGLTYQEAFQWRRDVADALKPHGIGVRFPVLNTLKPEVTYSTQGGDDSSVLTAPRGIITNDRWCVQNSDIILMKLAGAKRISIGSMVEYGWADAYRKPIVTIMDLDGTDPHDHVFVKELSGFVVDSEMEAVRIIRSVLR